ncbi:uncharacterized protein BDR25DRAFT_80967 [Lindgomyces ingoldianus]|uniref:Uncharacterized protein n=1 Tax=Lindgomyces ingoldianus TaxID=673940 RepID=A0ACB6QG58_9PLEO|nr:uncharacterized protein BDR25DRAFT_80967 [Lindgomyces ingoldianus]KAF2465909.1 hypothetical protein BDR25DRAFT_80967 [Lindgomyces ingoldianus]
MGNQISSFVEDAFNRIKDKAIAVLRSILPPVVQYAVQHPIQTVTHIACATLFLVPSLIVAPVLSILGFTSVGVATGTIAAGVQSIIGPVMAGGMFATLTSAAMGGYGAATVAGVVSGAAVVAEGINVAVEAANEANWDNGDSGGEE